MGLDERDRTQRVERVESVERTSTVAPVAPRPQTNVNAVAAAPVFTMTRVLLLLFTVLEVLLLIRFVLKLTGANAQQPLVAGLYGMTEPLVRPFQGIFAIPEGLAFDVAALLAIIFLFLVAALIVAIVRAIAGRTA